MNAHRDPLEVERLLTANSLRRSLAEQNRVTVDRHAAFQQSLTKQAAIDDIDQWLESEFPQTCDPYEEQGPRQIRSEREVSRVLSLLDEIGKGGAH